MSATPKLIQQIVSATLLFFTCLVILLRHFSAFRESKNH